MLYILVPLVLLLALLRWKYYKPTVYRYSLVGELASHNLVSKHPYKIIFFIVRFLALLGLALLIAKPQLVDPQSKVTVEGVDIVLVLDVSGSMQFQDDEHDGRSRLDIAKAEAIRFVEKRNNDAIGLVIFGNDAISRCPLTCDKNILKEIVHDLHIGTINPDGTLLATAMATAANRLKQSKAKSKVMILLTDGEPSKGDMSEDVAIDIAKKLGIKVYTVGIGSDEDQLIMHPLGGFFPRPKINKELLTKIAHATGGRFFLAKSSDDMRLIYDIIDALEKTENEAPIFNRYYDYFIPFVWLIGGLILFELVMSSLVWFSL